MAGVAGLPSRCRGLAAVGGGDPRTAPGRQDAELGAALAHRLVLPCPHSGGRKWLFHVANLFEGLAQAGQRWPRRPQSSATAAKTSSRSSRDSAAAPGPPSGGDDHQTQQQRESPRARPEGDRGAEEPPVQQSGSRLSAAQPQRVRRRLRGDGRRETEQHHHLHRLGRNPDRGGDGLLQRRQVARHRRSVVRLAGADRAAHQGAGEIHRRRLEVTGPRSGRHDQGVPRRRAWCSSATRTTRRRRCKRRPTSNRRCAPSRSARRRPAS